MQGLRIDSLQSRDFSTVFSSVLKQLEGRYWLIDAQSGPFSITDKPNWEELLKQLEILRVSIPEFEDSSQGLWKPAVFPLLCKLLVVEEWTYLVGLNGDERSVIEHARRFSQQGLLSPGFFHSLASTDSILLVHVDGWWEAYSSDEALMNSLRELPDVSPIDSEKWRKEFEKA